MASNELQNTLDRILKEKNEKLIPENIKKGVTILGVVGDATIDMTDATATPDDIVAGKTAYLRDGIATGTMVNNGAISITPSAIEQVIPAGYHNGNGKVRAVSASVDSNIQSNNIKKGITILGVTGNLDVLDTSDATANRSTILIGSTAYVNGEKITGIMPNNGRLTYQPSIRAQAIPTGYTSGGSIAAVTHTIDDNIRPGNIKQGVTILGVEGNLTSTGIDTSDATATADKILSGYTAYVDDDKITGTMSNRGSLSVTPRTNSLSYAGGYYSSINIGAVTASIDSNIIASNIKQGVTILGVTGNLISDDIERIIETITPSSTSDIVRTNRFYDRLTVQKVTSNIDSNIQPANIKSGVTILGVEGTLEQDVNYQAGTLTVLSSKYINYSPVWQEGTITSSFVVEDNETSFCSVTDITGTGYTKIKCYFNLVQAQDIVFEYNQITGIYAVFSEIDKPLGSGLDTTINVFYNTNNSESGNVTYTEIGAGSHYVEIKVLSSVGNSVFKFRPTGTNIRQKIVSQVYASTEAMNGDLSQSVGTYAFIFSLVENSMIEVYRFNGEHWIKKSIGDYSGSLLPEDYSNVLKQIDDISGEVIV